MSDINTSDQLHSISHLGKHADYNWIVHHLQHVSMWDEQRHFIYREVHHVISNEEYIGWCLSITRQIITPNLAQVPPREEIEYKPYTCWIQNVVSIYYFL